MFVRARSDLRELIDLTEKIATYDATLNANRTIVPEPSAAERRAAWERRKMALMEKYELL